ncbi:hypothetical protein LF927_12730 [Pectobacterium polaris]|uniref:hypothetical protein n=1 Tax=Pectobacterium polaris TaxID=2042057 RepID=UPI001CF3B61C|nr:hypothetical protein [Pectobacterium polaris]MCA6942045.1 hypothetical protein [Pectobacterium polaris]MCA6956226.1 hypothetical protein [Pectobacterium polaris]
MNDSVSYDIIATPYGKNLSGGGTVKILFYIDSDRNIQVIDPEIFPSEKCWIIKDYESAIEEKYRTGEIFKISGVNRTNYSQDYAKSPDNYIEWCCIPTNKISSISNDLYRVIDCQLPDKDTGELYWNDDDIPRGIYFINQSEVIYGPFEVTIEVSDNNRKYLASAYNTPSISVPTHHVTSTKFNELRKADLMRDAIIDGKNIIYICNLKRFTAAMKASWGVVDYISASQLMKFISAIKIKNGKKLMSNSVLTQVRQELEAFFKDKHDDFASDRYTRAISLLSKENENKDTWMNVIDAYIQTDAGKEALEKHAVDKYVKDINEQIKQKNSELSKIGGTLLAESNRLSELHKSRDEITLSIKEQEDKLTRTQEEVESKIRSQTQVLQIEKEQLEQDNLSLKNKLDILKQEYSALTCVQEINQEINNLDRDKTRLTQAVEHLKSQLQSPKNMVEKMTEVHTVMDLLGYSQRQSKNIDARQRYSIRKPVFNLNPNIENTTNFISTIANRINDMEGRELSEIEVANLLICTQQNMLTILQGRPGVGKTSTAINLAAALDIYNPTSSDPSLDFLNIPVARGWTGTRDLLGFYNGLRGEFQASKTGLYDFLINGEDIKNNASLRLVLLDEANLSPIEHYWSDFIGLTDKEGKSRPIDTGSIGATRYIYPGKYNSLRFIATINNDSTTENISPRLLSRAPVISMDNIKISSEELLGGQQIEMDGALSLTTLEAMFGRTAEYNDNSYGGDLYEELQKVIDTGLNISPSLRESLLLEGRKQQSIIKYLDVAGSIMVDNKAQAQDFALAQFVLPHLKGEGEKVRMALSAMIDQAKSNNLERSSQILERILNDGDSYLNSYSFL